MIEKANTRKTGRGSRDQRLAFALNFKRTLSYGLTESPGRRVQPADCDRLERSRPLFRVGRLQARFFQVANDHQDGLIRVEVGPGYP
jgi:hypothetical protein